MAKTYRGIKGVSLPLGGEWDAGIVLRSASGGRVSVRRVPDGFEVFFRPFFGGTDVIFYRFPPTDDGEYLAKQSALRVLKDLRR